MNHWQSHQRGSAKKAKCGEESKVRDGKKGWVCRQAASKPETDLFPMCTESPLHAKMCCQYKDGRFSAYWNVGLTGHQMSHFNPITGMWTDGDFGFNRMKNRDVSAILTKISLGDCRTWLEKLKLHWEEKLEPTGNWEEGRKSLQMRQGWGGRGERSHHLESWVNGHFFPSFISFLPLS